MKSDGCKIHILLVSASALLLLCGCTTTRSDVSSTNVEPASSNASISSPKIEAWGMERVFTNAHVVMWVPSLAKDVWDGPTTVIHVDEITPPHAFVKDYKIVVEIQILNTPQELQQIERWASSDSSDWYSQTHPDLSVTEVQYGK